MVLKKMSVISLLFSGILMAASAVSADPSKDEMIKEIRAEYIKIENTVRKVKPVSVTHNEFDYFLCYNTGKTVHKIELFKDDFRISFYFRDRKVFFIFIENAWNRAGGGLSKPYREERIYFYGGRIIEALLKETDAESFAGVENKPHNEILSEKPKYEEELLDGYWGAYVALQACEAALQ